MTRAGAEFTFSTSSETYELVDEIVDELVTVHGVTRLEAVARANCQWGGLDLSGPDDIVLHEDAYYWAIVILYERPIPDWWEGADRTSWARRPAPETSVGT